MLSQGSQTWLRSPISSQGSKPCLRSPMSSQDSQTWLRSPMSSQGSQTWLRSPMSNQDSQTWLRSHMSSQGSQTWLRSPTHERRDPYIWYVGRVWRYQRGGQNSSIENGQKTNYNMTNNEQHKSSPKSALLVIDNMKGFKWVEHFFLFFVKFLYMF